MFPTIKKKDLYIYINGLVPIVKALLLLVTRWRCVSDIRFIIIIKDRYLYFTVV